MPLVDPWATMQLSPAQQSALTVQPPHAATHVVDEQMKRGMPESTPASAAAGLGTHGSVLQQSALETHAPPAFTHVESVQRGTPTLSSLHVSLWHTPLQQSHDERHCTVPRRQTSPLGLHACGLRQTPRMLGDEMAHAPGWSKQQSLSCRHTSPTTRHPLAGWQTKTPVGPYGAHRRLQHGPPHGGRPESAVATPPQTTPSIIPQLAGPPGGPPHVPSG
jgi:hypothetical protein